MNNNNLHGWKNVFAFTLKEEIKQKSYRITLAIFFVIALLSMPIMTIISDKAEDSDDKATKLESIVVYDETGLNIDYNDFTKEEKYSSVKIEDEPQIAYEEKVEELKNAKLSKEMVVKIGFGEDGLYKMTQVSSPEAEVNRIDLEHAIDDFVEFFDEARLQALDVTQEQVDYMTAPVSYETVYISEKGEINEDIHGLGQDEYWFVYTLLMIAILLITFTGQKLATSIITEKSTRVIEYLTINVKPLALLVGKLFATLLLVIIQGVVVGSGILLSMALNKAINGSDAVSITEFFGDIFKLLEGLSVASVILVVLIIFAGVVFYSLLAGLAGSTVSKLEEMNDGLTLFTVATMLGAYSGMALLMAETSGSSMKALMYVCTFFPLSAPFVVPGYLLMGKMSILVAVLSLILLIIMTILMFIFTARVFILTIMYQGSRLKLKDLIGLAKNKPVESEGK